MSYQCKANTSLIPLKIHRKSSRGPQEVLKSFLNNRNRVKIAIILEDQVGMTCRPLADPLQTSGGPHADRNRSLKDFKTLHLDKINKLIRTGHA